MKLKTLKDYIQNGGATLDGNGQAVVFGSGYQCSVKDIAILSAVDYNGILATVNELLKTIKKGECVGLWIDGGKCYIDLSVRIRSRKTATKQGKRLNQLALWSWARAEAVTLRG